MPQSVHDELRELLLADEEAMVESPVPVDHDRDRVWLAGKCPGCLVDHRIGVDRANYERFEDGDSLLEAFPGINQEQVAMFERGWHAHCYREWWGNIRRRPTDEAAA